MKRYFKHIEETRTPHERRQFALSVAGVITAILFVVWISTIGVRFVTTGGPEAVQNAAATLIPVGNATTTFGF